MTTYSAYSPTLQGTTVNSNPAATGDKLTQTQRLMLHVNNTTGSAVTLTLEDVRTQQPAGAVADASFADLPLVCPANVRTAFYVGGTSRFTNSQGLISL